jgi:hypothetical protein
MEVNFKARLERRRPIAVRVLSSIVAVTSGGLDYEADQRHAEILIMDVGVDEGSKGITTPGSNSEGGQDVRGEVKGNTNESRYRAVSAGGNYLGQDRMDMQLRPRRSRGSCPSRTSRSGRRRRDWRGTLRMTGESYRSTGTRSCRAR